MPSRATAAATAPASRAGRLVTEGDGGRLEDVKVIFRQEPSYASGNHFGSRIVFAATARCS